MVSVLVIIQFAFLSAAQFWSILWADNPYLLVAGRQLILPPNRLKKQNTRYKDRITYSFLEGLSSPQIPIASFVPSVPLPAGF
jgi:hypothetical protein